jgi:hypothetical protein
MPKVYAAELRRVRGSDDSNSAEPRSGASGAARARLKGLAGGSGTDQISIETRAKMGSLPWTPTEAASSAASGPPADPGPVGAVEATRSVWAASRGSAAREQLCQTLHRLQGAALHPRGHHCVPILDRLEHGVGGELGCASELLEGHRLQ